MANKNDIFTKHGHCHSNCGHSEFLVTDNLLGEFQFMGETERQMARDNLGIDFDGTWESITGNPTDNKDLVSMINESRTTIESEDPRIVIEEEKVKGDLSDHYNYKLSADIKKFQINALANSEEQLDTYTLEYDGSDIRKLNIGSKDDSVIISVGDHVDNELNIDLSVKNEFDYNKIELSKTIVKAGENVTVDSRIVADPTSGITHNEFTVNAMDQKCHSDNITIEGDGTEDDPFTVSKLPSALTVESIDSTDTSKQFSFDGSEPVTLKFFSSDNSIIITNTDIRNGFAVNLKTDKSIDWDEIERKLKERGFITTSSTEWTTIVKTVNDNYKDLDDRLKVLEECCKGVKDTIKNINDKDKEQDDKLDALDDKDNEHDDKIKDIEDKNKEQDDKIKDIEDKDKEQDDRLDDLENKEDEQDDQIEDIKKNEIAQKVYSDYDFVNVTITTGNSRAVVPDDYTPVLYTQLYKTSDNTSGGCYEDIMTVSTTDPLLYTRDIILLDDRSTVIAKAEFKWGPNHEYVEYITIKPTEGFEDKEFLFNRLNMSFVQPDLKIKKLQFDAYVNNLIVRNNGDDWTFRNTKFIIEGSTVSKENEKQCIEDCMVEPGEYHVLLNEKNISTNGDVFYMWHCMSDNTYVKYSAEDIQAEIDKILDI